MKNFLAEFKAFAIKGNVVDLAVGVVIGSAFGKIITSLVNDIIMPLVSLLTGGTSFTELKIVLNPTTNLSINYGTFLQTMFDFLIIALCIFTVIKAMNKLSRKSEEEVEEAAAPSEEAALLQDILVELRKQK